MNTRIFMVCVTSLIVINKTSAQLGYLIKGASYIQGTVSDRGIFKNNRELHFIEKEKAVIYKPSQIEEYGFTNGDVYIKKTVHDADQENDYFLLRLVNGERTLFELKEKKSVRFFIAHDTVLTEIKNEHALKDQLIAQLIPCSSNQQIANSTRFSATSLKRAVLFSNKCYSGFFPRLRMGAMAGYEFSSQSLNAILDHIFLKANASYPVIGVFVELPLGMSRSWSMNVEATYQQSNFNKYQIENGVSNEYQFNFSAISFPLLLKYHVPSPTWRPFIAFGPSPAIYTQQQNVWLTTTYLGSTFYVDQGTWDNVKKFQVSGTLCAGLEYSITETKAVSLELRYKKLIDAQVGPSQSFALIGSYYF